VGRPRLAGNDPLFSPAPICAWATEHRLLKDAETVKRGDSGDTGLVNML
jgi:hypothetical protein